MGGSAVMLARIDEVSALDTDHLKRPPSRQIVDQVWITTSGIFSQPPFIAALQTFGIYRIMFSVDYPYAPNAKGRQFLDSVALSPSDLEKLTRQCRRALLKLKAERGEIRYATVTKVKVQDLRQRLACEQPQRALTRPPACCPARSAAKRCRCRRPCRCSLRSSPRCSAGVPMKAEPSRTCRSAVSFEHGRSACRSPDSPWCWRR
jgi:hypothetical protein